MKAIKYVFAGALMLSISATSMAQDVNPQVEAITKVIVDNKGNAAAIKAPVKEFLKLNKKNPEALAGLGRAFLEVKDYANAQLYAAQARKVGKSKACGYILEGDIAADQDNGGEAASWYQQATMFDPQDALGYVKYARVYQKIDPKGAVDMLENLRKVKPDYPVDAAAGYMYSQNDRLKTALEYYSKVKDLNNVEDYILYDYALTAFVLDEHEKSLQAALAGDRKGKSNAFSRMAFYNYYKMKDFANAEKFANKLFATKNDTVKFKANDFIYYAETLAGLKKYEEAVQAYRQLNTLEEKRDDVNKLISDLYKESGNYAASVDSYKAYINDLGDGAKADVYRGLANIYIAQANDDNVDEATKTQALKNSDDVWGTIADRFENAREMALHQRATINHTLDTDVKKGPAKQFYLQLIEIIEPKAEKNATDTRRLKEAYNYLAYHFIQNDNISQAKFYAQKLADVDPGNEMAKQILDIKGK